MSENSCAAARLVLGVILLLVATSAAGAQPDAITVVTNGDVGVGTNSPSRALHVWRSDGSGGVLVEETNPGPADLFELSANGNARMVWRDTAAGLFWRLSSEYGATNFVITRSGTGLREFVIDSDGNVEARGSITANVSAPLTMPDYVFEPDYPLMPLDELRRFVVENRHLPRVVSNEEVQGKGLNISEFQLQVLEKVEELTLYTLQQQDLIEEQRAIIERLSGRLDRVEGHGTD